MPDPFGDMLERPGHHEPAVGKTEQHDVMEVFVHEPMAVNPSNVPRVCSPWSDQLATT